MRRQAQINQCIMVILNFKNPYKNKKYIHTYMHKACSSIQIINEINICLNPNIYFFIKFISGFRGLLV